MPNDPFVDIAALPSLGSIRYLDARDRAAFDAGHAPGAVRAPVEEWDAAAKAADTGFYKTAYWDEALGSLGIDPSAVAVAYDAGGMTNAARVWFILQYFGFNCVILNGGWPVLSSASGLLAGAGPSKGIFRAVPGAGSVGLVDRETLKRQLPGDAQVFDTRTRAEFTGEDMRNRSRGGHLPGRPPSVAYRSAGQWRCSSGIGAASHAGAGRVRPGRSHCDPLRRRRTGGVGCSRGSARRV
jgi:thiosulfate/3-mercaptopyruvate sulfurtransferase